MDKEAYVEQPKCFEDPYFLNHVFKLKKAFYRLEHTLRAWYEKLAKFLIEQGNKRERERERERVGKTLFI